MMSKADRQQRQVRAYWTVVKSCYAEMQRVREFFVNLRSRSGSYSCSVGGYDGDGKVVIGIGFERGCRARGGEAKRAMSKKKERRGMVWYGMVWYGNGNGNEGSVGE